MTIVLDLTTDQQAALDPLMDKAREMAEAGKPGIVAAQVFPDHIRVGIISNEDGLAYIKKVGGDPDARIREAPERIPERSKP